MDPDINPQGSDENQQQNSTIMLRQFRESKPGPQRWKTSALTTALSDFPLAVTMLKHMGSNSTVYEDKKITLMTQ